MPSVFKPAFLPSPVLTQFAFAAKFVGEASKYEYGRVGDDVG